MLLFFNAKIKLDTSVYKLQGSGVSSASGSLSRPVSQVFSAVFEFCEDAVGEDPIGVREERFLCSDKRECPGCSTDLPAGSYLVTYLGGG